MRCSGLRLGCVPHRLHALRATRNQGHVGTLALQTHGVGGSSEGRGRPVLRLPALNIPGPGGKGFQGILSQLLHGLRHGPLLCQPGIEHLLHGPAGFAKFIQPHHARAALERVKRPAQRGLLAQVAGLIGQSLKGLQAVIHDFPGFLQEDRQQFIVAVQRFGTQLGGRRQGLCRSNCCAARAGQILAGMGGGDGIIRCRPARLHVRKHLGHGIGQGIGACHRRLGHNRCRHCLEVGQGTWFGCGPGRGVLVVCEPRLQGLRLRRRPQFGGRRRCSYRRLDGRCSCWDGRCGNRCGRRLRRRHALHGNIHGRPESFGAATAAVTHDDAQLVLFLVIDKQLARHIALVAEHVDEKAHGTQTAAQLLEDTGLILDRHLAEHQMLDGVTHALHGGRGLLEAQHRQHAAHLRHLARHRGQHRGIGGVAKEQIQLLLGLTQGDAQLAHHRSHGLLVAGLTVELLHPDFQRLGLRAMQRRIQTLDQHAGLGGLYLVVMPGGHEAGLQIQHRGRHLHGQLGRWWLADAFHRLGDTNQRARQTVADRLQLDQRLGHQPELLGHGPDLAAVATGDR